LKLPHTYLLTERKTSLCRLASADVEFLLAEHAAHVQCAPTGRRGCFRLTPSGHVGTIICPSCRLVIRPKIPLHNFFYLLDPMESVPVVEDQTTALSGTEGLDFLAGQLARRLTERASAGLHRAYAERGEQGPFLHGRLDLAAHLREPQGRKDLLHSRYDEFTADVPWNQLPKAAAELALRSPLLGESVRPALRRALEAYADVSSVVVGSDSFAALPSTRLTEAYRPLLDLCRILVESLTPGTRSGATPCPAFLIDLERVFERYVTRGIQDGFAANRESTFSAQRLIVVKSPQVAQPDLELRPDFDVARTGQTVLVGDIKWKRLPRTSLVTPDVYQILAYGLALGAQRGILVYPSRRNRLWRYSFPGNPMQLAIYTLGVTGTRHACTRALDSLARSIRRHVSEGL
jgi:5-methylcytosine-specific restriction enzyme subunit McrC